MVLFVAIFVAIISLSVAIILAQYGWWLTSQLAKGKEAYDLYSSSASILEQLALDGIAAWQNNPEMIDEHTKLLLLFKLETVELRLELIKRYYKGRCDRQDISNVDINELRRCLTASPELIPPGEPRNVAIFRRSREIVSTLLEANHEYSKRRGRKSEVVATVVGVVVLALLAGLPYAFYALTTLRQLPIANGC